MFGGALLTGCEPKSAGSECEQWADKLANSGEIAVSLENIRKLKCTEALPVLTAFFEDGMMRTAVIQTVEALDHPAGSEKIIQAAVQVPDTARVAADLAKAWEMEAAVPALAEALQNDKLLEQRDSLLGALLTLSEASEHEALLISLAMADPTKQAISVNRQAIEELGEMGSSSALSALTRATFFRNHQGQEAYAVVRMALAQIGGPAVRDAYLTILRDEDNALKAALRPFGLPDWAIAATPKTVQILGETLDPQVVEPLIAELKKEINQPEGMGDREFDAWVVDFGNRLKLISIALGHIGSDLGVAELGEIAADMDLDAVNQRLNASYALGLIGSEAAQDTLINVWERERIGRMRAAYLGHLALALDHRRIDAWDELLGLVPEGKTRPVKKVTLQASVQRELDNNETIKTYVGLVRSCKDDRACWEEKLSSENQDEQVKAIWTFSKGLFGAGEDIRALLWDVFEKAPKAHVDTKRYALMGLTRLGNAADGEKMIAKGKELQGDDIFWGPELMAYGYGLSHRMRR